MPFPRMSVFVKQFTPIDDPVSGSSKNPVKKVSFIDSLGNTVIGFFKSKSDHYTPFQIKYAVASSVLMRLFVGDKAAEERLVFNEAGEIVGSVSIWCPDYKAMKAWKPWIFFRKDVEDPEVKKIVNPSTTDLLKLYFARLLTAATRIKGEDFHGDNFCPTAAIDAERYVYPILAEVLGHRWSDGDPVEALRFRSEHLSNYPNDGRCTHWPANDIPQCISIEKIHAAAEAVQRLASNPSIETENGYICFNDQKLTATLFILLIYNSDLLQAHLTPYLEGLPLDFMSLKEDSANKEAVNRLMGKFPQYFNKETNKESFIKHYCAMQQNEHNEYYRANVFYWGCKENKYHVPVPGFWEFLKNRPSAFKEILAWMAEQNKIFAATWEKEQESSDSSNSSPPYSFGPECHFNLQAVEAAYHQIYRDSRGPLIYDCLMELNASYSKLLTQKSEPHLACLNLEDHEFTSVRQIFGNLIIPNPLDGNELHLNIYTLLQGLNKAIQEYTDLKGENLTQQANDDFIEAYKRLLAIYLGEIERLNPPAEWYDKFKQIIATLKLVCKKFSFKKHLNSKNAPFDTPINILAPKFITRENTNKKVVSTGILALFEWAKTVDRSLLIDLLLNILRQYEPHPLNVLSNRKRHFTIERYLKSTEDDGPNILAYILSTGKMETTSLNCKMVEGLLNYMVYQHLDVKDLSLFAIRSAIEKKEFDIRVYTQEAIHYASSMNEAITNKHSNFTIKKFYDEIYNWAEKQDNTAFTQLLNKSIDAHRSYFSLSFFSNASTYEAELIKSNYSQSEKLACLFYEANDALAQTLFNNVREAMMKSPTVRQDYPTVNNFNPVEDGDLYLKKLSQFASLQLNIDDETLARFAHALFYFADSLNQEIFHSLLKEVGLPQDEQGEKVANSYLLARLLKKENEKISEQICIKLKDEIIASFAQNKSRLDAAHFETVLRFNMSLQGRYLILRREDFANLRLRPPFSPKELIKKIFTYAEHMNAAYFNSLIEESILLYEENISSYTTPRSGTVREIIEKEYCSNKEKLAQIFKTGGVDSTSLNTQIFRRLTKELHCTLEPEDEAYYLKDLHFLAEKKLQAIIRTKTRDLSFKSEVKIDEEEDEFKGELVFHCV